jgi:4-amino-4-deoxy-L-arabinose transferase-like glycosyltransferase
LYGSIARMCSVPVAEKASTEKRVLFGASAVVICITAAKLLIHLYTGRHYGYFVDELYYLACSRHLAWGYVDQPPLIALLTWTVRKVLGQSLPALRLLPAMAGAAEVALTAFITGELGGKRFAQALAVISALVAPGILLMDNLLTMNAFEPLFWMGCAYLLIRIIKAGNQTLWIWFGIVAGVGLENKYSMLIFGAGMVLGLLLTKQRRLLASPWVWIGGAVAFLIFAPNLWWNIRHHFPFLELQANIRHSGRNVSLGFVKFFRQEAQSMLQLTIPIWLAGLWFFFSGRGREFRALGWASIFAAAVIVTTNPRVYYLFPLFPLLFAAGGVSWESWLEGPRLGWVRAGYPALMIAAGALFAPLAIPVLPPETYIRYSNALHIKQPRIENHALGPLPQIFADQFGWKEMTAVVARAYHSLPPDVRAKTAIFAQNYGQAGAIDLFGPQYGLPPAISAHQSYFLWGPRNYTGESMIVMDDRKERLEQLFASVQKVGTVYHPYSMPYEHFDVYYCRGMKWPLKEIWPKLKKWD